MSSLLDLSLFPTVVSKYCSICLIGLLAAIDEVSLGGTNSKRELVFPYPLHTTPPICPSHPIHKTKTSCELHAPVNMRFSKVSSLSQAFSLDSFSLCNCSVILILIPSHQTPPYQHLQAIERYGLSSLYQLLYVVVIMCIRPG